jgi:hypothetical protein
LTIVLRDPISRDFKPAYNELEQGRFSAKSAICAFAPGRISGRDEMETHRPITP